MHSRRHSSIGMPNLHLKFPLLIVHYVNSSTTPHSNSTMRCRITVKESASNSLILNFAAGEIHLVRALDHGQGALYPCPLPRLRRCSCRPRLLVHSYPLRTMPNELTICYYRRFQFEAGSKGKTASRIFIFILLTS